MKVPFLEDGLPIPMFNSWRGLRMLPTILILLAMIFVSPPSGGAQSPATEATTLKIAAAADLQFAMQDLAQQFGRSTDANANVKIDVIYGSSGNFFAQIQNGAPFDLFFSADMDYAKKLDAAGIAEPGTLARYAVGRLVLWTPPGVAVNVVTDGWKTLLDARVQKIAVRIPSTLPTAAPQWPRCAAREFMSR